MTPDQVAACPGCGQTYSITPQQSAAFLERGFDCTECGAHVGGNVRAAIPLSYAVPGLKPGDSPVLEGGPWRDGKILVLRKGGWIPRRCVRCGCDALGDAVEQKLTWHSKKDVGYIAVTGVLMIAVGALGGAARIAGGAGQEIQISVPLCEEHRRRRFKFMVGWYLAGAAMFAVSILLATQIQSDDLWSLGIFGVGALAMLVAIFAAGDCRQVVAIRKVDANFIHLRGCAPAFLETLPDISADLGSPR